ncbi:TetR/AcrR family transcriptional regulator [Streptomyces sp. NPDC060366]|uniref:TetR/AcrR family transcriptional regulator n=1 Tax=Streptomyces sp. NPDC060366 TaxID=3347105 RepID=UPI003651B981
MPDTRTRILTEAMRLFGELGYTATTISKIEEAAGLSPGSGALYKHFRSKRDILRFGLRERISKKDALTTLLGTEAPATDPRVLLRAVAKSGLERLVYERDVNRILVRDLAAFPELLEEFRTAEVARIHAALTQLLQTQATAHATAHTTSGVPDTDWSAVAAILQDALSHYWLMADIYGGAHPTGVTEDAYLDTLTDLALALVPAPPPKDES